MGLTEGHWFEDEDILNERQLENEIEYDERRYQAGYEKGYADALELLKEQEPIEPKRTVDEHGQILKCGNCGAWFEVQFQKYCHECGRKVKWK